MTLGKTIHIIELHKIGKQVTVLDWITWVCTAQRMKTADLVTFTEKKLNVKLYFLWRANDDFFMRSQTLKILRNISVDNLATNLTNNLVTMQKFIKKVNKK